MYNGPMSSTSFYRPQALANVLASRLGSYSSPDSLVLSSYRSAGEDGPAMLKCLLAQHGAKLSDIRITDTHRTSLVETLIKLGSPDLLDLGLNLMAYPNINWGNIINTEFLLPAWSRAPLLATLKKQNPYEGTSEYNYPLMFYLHRAAKKYLNPKNDPDPTWLDVISDIQQARPSYDLRPLSSVLLPSYVRVRYDVAHSGKLGMSAEQVDARLLSMFQDLSARGIELDVKYQIGSTGVPKPGSSWYENSLHEALEEASQNHYWLPCVDQLINFIPWKPVLQADLSPAARQLLLAQPLVCRTLLTQVSQQANPLPASAKTKPKI